MKFREVTWTWAVTEQPPSHRCPIDFQPNSDPSAEFREEILTRLEDDHKWPQVEGVILFENLALDSSSMGQRQVLIYGEGCTYDGRVIGQIMANPMSVKTGGPNPSQWQYPQWYITREKHRRDVWENSEEFKQIRRQYKAAYRNVTNNIEEGYTQEDAIKGLGHVLRTYKEDYDRGKERFWIKRNQLRRRQEWEEGRDQGRSQEPSPEHPQ